jgi:hypothetical protein
MSVAPLPSLLGVDFSSRPSTRKAIVMATGQLHGSVLRLAGVQRFTSLQTLSQALAQSGPWGGWL